MQLPSALVRFALVHGIVNDNFATCVIFDDRRLAPTLALFVVLAPVCDGHHVDVVDAHASPLFASRIAAASDAAMAAVSAGWLKLFQTSMRSRKPVNHPLT
jgi:hypothetical protein